jgi:hypothetical protein
MQNEMSFTVYVNGIATCVLASNQFHALNRARKIHANANVSLKAPFRKVSRVQTTYRNNGRSFGVRVFADGTTWDLDWKKSKKKVDSKSHFLYLNTMTNDFATISAENNLCSMITLSIEEINEANAWFDMVSAQFDETEATWDRLAEYVDNI